VYAFYDGGAHEWVGSRRAHTFKCLGKGCKHTVRRYLTREDGRKAADAGSTSNMIKHVRTCWGEAALSAASKAGENASKVVKGILKNGSITAAFEVKGRGKVTYSHIQHTKTETRYGVVFRNEYALTSILVGLRL
jgi:hypothetical protein